MVRVLLTCMVAVLLCMACGNQEVEAPVAIKEETLAYHLDTLSKDYFEGRKPFTRGEERTVEYLINSLKSMGVGPGNGDSYIQEVPLVEITGTPQSNITLQGSPTLTWSLGKDYATYTEQEEEQIDVTNSEMIFCGFGVVAPEYQWNDFADVDVKGKTVVVLVNDPGFGGEDTEFFKGNTMTYYGRWTYKYEEAARQGAAAVFIIHETASAGYPWFVVESSWSGGQLGLSREDKGADKCPIQAWLHLDAAKSLFAGAGVDLAKAIRDARTRSFKPIPLGYKLNHSISNKLVYNTSANVIGLIEGSERPDETILYSAHWDHLGIGAAVDGDSIYNGALDNASGTSCILSIAEAFAQGPNPERSVAFLFVTAEEQGLLGSAFYGEHPIFDPYKSVANLNMDGMSTYGRMKYLTITGIGQSEMDEYAAAEAEKQGRLILADPNPEKGYFFRSDHFNFAKIGIPALYAQGGKEHVEKGEAYVKEQENAYLSDRYHAPADEYDPETWDLGGMLEDANLYLNIGRRLAAEETFPKWYDGSEFKAAREKPVLN